MARSPQRGEGSIEHGSPPPGGGGTDERSQPELRIDPLTGLRVLVAGSRAARPGGLPKPDPVEPIDPESDPFAEGQELRTPLEVWADRPNEAAPNTPGWRVRSVPNLYPALAQRFAGDAGGADTEAPLSGIAGGAGIAAEAAGLPPDPLGTSRGTPALLVSGPAYGLHEVIVNSPRPVQSLAELEPDELKAAVDGWASRMRHHRENPAVAYAHVCVNEGKAAGASLPHTHAQLYVLPFVPALVARERERMRFYHEQTQGRSLMEDLLAEEVRLAERLVAIDDDAALVSPFAAATPYRLWVLPRRREAQFETSEHRGVNMLHTALRALRAAIGGTPALNLWVRTAPPDAEGFGWRIEIAPRLGQPAGMELGTGVYINSVPPEAAAANLRAALD